MLTIDLAAIEANWKKLARRAMPAECAAVVKADGYGCGIEPVARTLAEAGCKTFFVADLGEARRVRARRAGAGDLRAQRPHAGHRAGLRRHQRAAGDRQPRPSSPNGTRSCRQRLARRRGAACRHRHEPARHLSRRSGSAGAAHPLRKSRHHAADEPSRLRRTRRASAQRQADPALPRGPHALPRHSLPRSPIRPASSSAAAAHCDLVRPGAALFGVNPTPGQQQSDARRWSNCTAASCRCATSPKGETVGYGATWTAKRATRLAIVAVGYADGYPRAASATDARRAPRRSSPASAARSPAASRWTCWRSTSPTCRTARSRRGDLATLLGDGISVDDLAAAAGTIGYEVLTSLGRRYHRVYRAD